MKHRPATVLPLEASRQLQQAAATPTIPGNPIPRLAAIEKATREIKAKYPHLFRKD